MTWTRRTRIFAGILAFVAGLNLVNVVVPSRRVAAGTCPSIFTNDSHLGASVVAGALYPWAEGRDVAPLPALRATDGEYRLRLENHGEDTTDLVESMALLLVDHDADTEVLATPAGRLVAVRDAVAPRRTIRHVDPSRKIETWILELERPPAHTLLILEARSTPFAEKAFLQYLATMGRGVSPLMEYSVRTDCGTTCAREVMADELDRLGLSLHITGPAQAEAHVAPTSPALPRRFAVPIDLFSGDRITIRLEAVPGFWEVNQIQVAADSDEVASRTLEPRAALLVSTGAAPEDVRARLRDGDGDRVLVRPREHIDARFDAPPQVGAKRSVFVAVRAHYRVPIGGALVHPLSILAHRWGVTSLPRFAADLPRP